MIVDRLRAAPQRGLNRVQSCNQVMSSRLGLLPVPGPFRDVKQTSKVYVMSTKTWQNNRSNGQDNGLARDFFKT